MVEVPQMGWYDDTDTPKDAITVKQLDELCEVVSKQRGVVDEMKGKLKEQQEVLDGLELKLLAALTDSGKNSWKVGDALFTKVTRFSVQTPKEMPDKLAFFDYLKQRGVFEELVNIHSNTLNSFYKQEQENASKEGRILSIPGIKEPTSSETLSVRRA
jgi:hypothetical protein